MSETSTNGRITPATALIVPMVAADPIVRPWRIARGVATDEGVPAHVTLLYPFLPPDMVDESARTRLRKLFARFRPFEVTFRRTARVEGLLYLAPEPEEAFQELHYALRREWPALLPYEGRYGTHYTPHLSVAYGEAEREAPDEVFPTIEADLCARLPFTSMARAVWLLKRREVDWVHRGTFPFLEGMPVRDGGEEESA